MSYTKILALGPGQVGKSTFLYRLMGLMKGNIKTADPKTQPQQSTGIAEQREACIKYTSRSGSLMPDKTWQVFEESTELESKLSSIMSLICEPVQDEIEMPAPKLRHNSMPETVPPRYNEINTSTKTPSESSREKSISKTVSTGNEINSWFDQYILSPVLSVVILLLLIPVFLFTPLFNIILEDRYKCDDERTEVSDSVPDPSLSQTDIEKVTEEFKALENECKFKTIKEKPAMLFNIADIGGQPAFLDMLPSLTIGPALYNCI